MKDLDYNIDDEVSEVYVILAMRILYVTGGGDCAIDRARKI